jgi:hypothetical protein
MAAAATAGAELLPGSPSRRPVTASSTTRSRRTSSLAEGLRVHPPDEDGRRHRALRGPARDRDLRAVGVVAAIVPTANPTSTAIYKIAIALKRAAT